MVKFSAIHCSLLWIFMPVLFSIDKYTEGKNHRALRVPEYSLHEGSQDRDSSSVKKPKPPWINRRKRSVADFYSFSKFQVVSPNYTDADLNYSQKDSNSRSDVSTPEISRVHIQDATWQVEKQEERNDTSELLIQNQYLNEINAETTTISANRINATTRSLTLMNFNGPVIYQDLENSRDDVKRIRVKRGSQDFDERMKTSRFENDDRSNVTNKLEDVYPDLIDDAFDSNYDQNLENPNFAKRRRKRCARSERKATRKAGKHTEPDKTRKPKHRKKHKKRKKGKKPIPKEEERSARAMNADSNFAMPSLVSELQVEAHIEKRDSGEARSEVDINKREISKNDDGNDEISFGRGKRTVESQGKISGEKNSVNHRLAKCRNEELRYYNDFYEPGLRTPRDYIATRSNSVYKTGKERAAKSVGQIKRLMEKIIGKVDELETYVRSTKDVGHSREKKGTEDYLNSTNSNIDGMDLKNVTSDRSESKVCADEAVASRSKLDMETSGRDQVNEKTAMRSQKQTEEKRSTGIISTRGQSSGKIKRKAPHRKWDRWTEWSSCSVTCGKGRQIRWRHCVHDCISAETEMEEKACQLPACGPGKFLGIF